MAAASSANTMQQQPPDDLTDVMWSDPQWLATFPLNESTALHYFSLSQFYDSNCNNELINMQRLDMSLLTTMSGIEYSVSSPCPELFIVHKRYRSINPPKLDLISSYYIYDGHIYQAPTLHAILSTRALQAIHHIKNAFEAMHSAAAFSSHGTHVWDPPPIPAEDISALDAPELTTNERDAVDDMLYDIWKKNESIAVQNTEKLQRSQNQPHPNVSSENVASSAQPQPPQTLATAIGSNLPQNAPRNNR